jgi:hypothetical protein
MRVYTVHQPPPKRYEGTPDPERFVFVRDGFSFWAFLFGPLWMLRHRMWLILIGYIAAVVAMQLALRQAGASNEMSAFVALLLALLVGVEAGTLRRFTLGRRRFRPLGVIVAEDREAAERRFFDSWVRGEMLAQAQPVPPAAPAGTPSAHRTPAAPEVIGLFPQSGSPR